MKYYTYLVETSQQGRFVWGRMGFQPNDEAWSRIHQVMDDYFCHLESNQDIMLDDIQHTKIKLYKEHIAKIDVTTEEKLAFYYAEAIMHTGITLAEEIMTLQDDSGRPIMGYHCATIDSDVQRDVLQAVIQRNLERHGHLSPENPERGIG